MSDTPEISVDPNTAGNANLIYILHLASILVGVTSIIGVIMAYMGKDGANEMLTSHYNNQINLFWKFMLYMVVGVVLSIVLIGFLVMLWGVVWFAMRNIKGMQALGRGEAIAAPGSWGL